MKNALATLLLLLLAFTACTTQTVVDEDDDGVADGTTIVNERTVVRDETAEGEGRIITGITGSASQSMKITIDSVELYSAEEDDWVIIASDEDTYDLVTASGLLLAGDEQIDAGTYTQLRLDISSVMVGNTNVQIPAEKFIVPVNLAIPAGSTTVVAVDIHGDESLQLINGRYVFTPVVSVNTCADATAMVDGRIVSTTCRVTPTVETYEQEITGRVVVNTVVREVPVIRVERYETTTNNTYVYNNTVIQRETVRDSNGTNTTTNTSVNATA